MATIFIVVDSREHDLWSFLTGGSPDLPVERSVLRSPASMTPSSSFMGQFEEPFRRNLERRQLTLGDVWVLRRDALTSRETPLVILERKTVPDLWASIRDGRYHEQHERVCAFIRRQIDTPIVYLRLFEGLPPQTLSNASSTPFRTITPEIFFHSCLKRFETVVPHLRIETVRTYNLRETVLLIYTLWKKETTAATAASSPQPSVTMTTPASGREILWKSLCHTTTRQGSTRQEGVDAVFLLAASLAVVPRLSFAAAERVASSFGTMGAFVAAYDKDPVSWSTMIEEAIGRSSPTVVRRIISLFFTPHAQDVLPQDERQGGRRRTKNNAPSQIRQSEPPREIGDDGEGREVIRPVEHASHKGPIQEDPDIPVL